MAEARHRKAMGGHTTVLLLALQAIKITYTFNSNKGIRIVLNPCSEKRICREQSEVLTVRRRNAAVFRRTTPRNLIKKRQRFGVICEASIFTYQTTRRHIPEDGNPHNNPVILQHARQSCPCKHHEGLWGGGGYKQSSTLDLSHPIVCTYSVE